MEIVSSWRINCGERGDNRKNIHSFISDRVKYNRELAFLDVTRSQKPKRLPVVLSRPEIAQVVPEFRGLKRLMFLVMYGAGLRHKECCRLRVKDICFDDGHIIVRNGKGDKDRITVLPDCCRNDLIEQVEEVRRQHKRDLEAGFGRVYLPHALERKSESQPPHPGPLPLNGEREESSEFGWQWVFPSNRLAKDPRSGERRMRCWRAVDGAGRPDGRRGGSAWRPATTRDVSPSSGLRPPSPPISGEKGQGGRVLSD